MKATIFHMISWLAAAAALPAGAPRAWYFNFGDPGEFERNFRMPASIRESVRVQSGPFGSFLRRSWGGGMPASSMVFDITATGGGAGYAGTGGSGANNQLHNAHVSADWIAPLEFGKLAIFLKLADDEKSAYVVELGFDHTNYLLTVYDSTVNPFNTSIPASGILYQVKSVAHQPLAVIRLSAVLQSSGDQVSLSVEAVILNSNTRIGGAELDLVDSRGPDAGGQVGFKLSSLGGLMGSVYIAEPGARFSAFPGHPGFRNTGIGWIDDAEFPELKLPGAGKKFLVHPSSDANNLWLYEGATGDWWWTSQSHGGWFFQYATGEWHLLPGHVF